MKQLKKHLEKLAAAARDKQPVSGLTHCFYRYPARFSPVFARAAIECFSRHGDVVLDPYMGGGTTVVEAMATGRRAVGNDLNSLAAFIAKVKTTILKPHEVRAIREWANHDVPQLSYRTPREQLVDFLHDSMTHNLTLPRARFIKKIVAGGKSSIATLPSKNAKNLALCAMLSVGQWALDGKKSHTTVSQFRSRLSHETEQMLMALDELRSFSKSQDIPRPHLHNLDAADLASVPLFAEDGERVNLVVTSPPYPGVHILYHRWQVDGRKETPAPYWIAGCNDGHPSSYYNFADRRQGADDRYFETSLRTLQAIRSVMADDGIIVQMVAFARPETQLPKYLRNMEKAGFREMRMAKGSRRIRRTVPNRRWHANLKGRLHASQEVILLHEVS